MKFNGDYKVGNNVVLGRNVRVGDRTVIYDNVVIGDNTTIANDCIIGEPAVDYYLGEGYTNPKTVIGPDSIIRSHTILYCDSRFGAGFETGHRVTIREGTQMGRNCRVGTLSDLQGNMVFGDYCWLHSSVHIGQQSRIGSFVFIYPFVVFTNDPHPPSTICEGPIVGDFSQIAVSSVLLPGAKIGEHVLVGAHSVVGGVVEDYKLVLGNPAKPIKDVRDLRSRATGLSHYPWPENFERGMPWEGIGFNGWQARATGRSSHD